MQISTPAKYFDGKTSKPYLLELEVFHHQVSFYHNNRKYVWRFQDIQFEKAGDSLTLTRKDDHSQSLKISDPETATSIYRSAKSSGKVSWYHSLLDLGPKIYLASTATVIVAIASFYIFVIPWLSKKVTDLIPISFDEEIGETSFRHVSSFSDIDENKSSQLQAFADHLNFETTRKLSFKVINDKEINAYALPNGSIVVYTGLLNKIDHYDELAALLGHEVTHVKERHSTKTLARSLAGYLVVSVVIDDVNGVMTSLADNANQLNNLSFSRQFETASDLGSYDILKKNKINPDGMYRLFVTLKENDKMAVPKILSSHPLNAERLNDAKKLADQKEYQFSENPALEKLFKKLKEN